MPNRRQRARATGSQNHRHCGHGAAAAAPPGVLLACKSLPLTCLSPDTGRLRVVHVARSSSRGQGHHRKLRAAHGRVVRARVRARVVADTHQPRRGERLTRNKRKPQRSHTPRHPIPLVRWSPRPRGTPSTASPRRSKALTRLSSRGTCNLRAKSLVGETRAAPVSGQPSMHARVVLVLLCMSSARTGAALSRRCFCRICRNHGGGGGSAVGSSHHARA